MGQKQNKPTEARQREAKLLTEAIDRAKDQRFQETSRNFRELPGTSGNFLQQEQDKEK